MTDEHIVTDAYKKILKRTLEGAETKGVAVTCRSRMDVLRWNTVYKGRRQQL